MSAEKYKKASDVLLQKFKGIDGKAIGQKMIDDLKDDFKENILPIEDLQKRSRELTGGKCPMCSKPWEKIVIQTKLMITPFEYYQASCGCEVTEEEVVSRERLIVSRLRMAGIKGDYLNADFDKWDNTVDPHLTKCMVEVKKHFFKGFFKQGIGLILTGTVGTGKTFCAVAVLRMAAKYTDSILFVRMAEYIPMILDDKTGKKTIQTMKNVRLIVLDDIEKVASSNEWVKGRIFEIIEARTAAGLPIILTSNVTDPKDFEDMFGAPVASRLFGYCVPVNFNGNDYRKLRRMRQDEMAKSDELSVMKQGELL